MEKIIEKLKESRVIYETKLNDAMKALKEMDVKDDKFDSLLNKVSSLISLMIQEEHFIEEYNASKIMKEEK